MEKVSTRKSRRESRKEARLAKNVQRHESWIEHKKSQKLRRAQQSKKIFGGLRLENSFTQHSRNNKKGIQFDTDPAGEQILENSCMANEMGTKPGSWENSGSKASKIVKRRKSLANSKTKFEEFIEMDVKNANALAEEDLEIERRLAKKLKVKDGKLRGMDDEINFLFEGFPSLDDFSDRDMDTEEFSVEGFDKKGTSGKQHTKKKKVHKFLGNNIADDDVDGAFESEKPFNTEKECEESNIGPNSQRKLKKRRKEKQEGYILGGTSNDSEDMVGISEREETSDAEVEQEIANGSIAHKRRKKKKNSQKEEGDVVGDTTVGVSKAAETHELEMDRQETPTHTHVLGSSGRYVNSQLRFLAKDNPEDQIRLRISGLLHHLVEDNVESFTGQITTISHSLSRSVSSQIISDEVLAIFSNGFRSTEQNAATFAAFVAAMACSVGMDFSAKFLASLAKSFQDDYLNKHKISLNNLTLLLSYLCTFGVCSSDLIYDFLAMLSKELTDIDVFIIKRVLECCGMKLRSDDPTAMKDFIQSIHKRMNELKAIYGENLAKICGNDMESMLTRISDIKNNKKPKEDTSQHTRIKKWLQKLKVDEIIIRGLKWSKLLDPDKRGQWWLWGEMATRTDDVKEVANKIDKEVLEAQKMLQLAASQGMNTDTRKAIFCIIMSAEDYVDAFEKLLRLDLHGKQDREIMRVLLECCLHEKVFNKYYTVLARKLCEHDRNQKYTLQFCIWDQYKELDSMELSRSMHLAKFVAEMVAAFALSLSVVKKVELMEAGQLTPKTVIHFRMFFDAIFEYPDNLVWNMFTRIAIDPELEMLRNGIEFFIKKYVLKSNNAIASKFKIAKKALNNMEGVLM